MDELVKAFGSEEGLRLALVWDDAAQSVTAADVTRGSLRLSLRGADLWHGPKPGSGFPWTWVELLEFLSHGWPHLAWEDGFPLGLRPDDPARVHAQAENRWLNLPGALREEEAGAFEAFEEVHDLARAVPGALLPSVWVVREGTRCWVCGGGRSVPRPLEEVLGALEALGQEILARLQSTQDPRARAAAQAWAARARLSADEGIRIATGLPREVIAEVQRDAAPEAAWDLHGESFQVNELLAAARLAAGGSPRSIAAIVARIRRVPLLPTPDLDRLSGEVRSALDSSADERPYDQGHALAAWLRTELGVARDRARVDPYELLDDWGVRVVEVRLEGPEVDAFACWGPRHGPAIFLNLAGRHNTSAGGRNASLAHEICHLLVDRAGALPLAEVLGGRTSPLLEARARAFAAELLLPRQVAGEALARAGHDPAQGIFALVRKHGVSRELAAWQAHNSGVALSSQVTRYLRGLVSRPSEFWA